jgi:hypothetical protein
LVAGLRQVNPIHSLIHYSFVVNSVSYSDRSVKFLCKFLITPKSATSFTQLREKFTFIYERIIYVALTNEHSVFYSPYAMWLKIVNSSCTKEKRKNFSFWVLFVKLRKEAISFVMERVLSHWTDFLGIWSVYFSKKSRENSSLIKILQKYQILKRRRV